jgi:hypothetical protein
VKGDEGYGAEEWTCITHAARSALSCLVTDIHLVVRQVTADSCAHQLKKALTLQRTVRERPAVETAAGARRGFRPPI